MGVSVWIFQYLPLFDVLLNMTDDSATLGVALDPFLIAWLIGIFTIWPIWIWLSVSSRKKRGIPLIPKPPTEAEFLEKSVSGFKKGNPFARAGNCLTVCVTRTELWISPLFPLNLVMPYGWGTEYTIPIGDIIRAEESRTGFGKFVTVEFQIPGKPRTTILFLKLKAPGAFLTALGR